MSLVGGSGVIYVADAYLDFQSAGGGVTLADGTSITSGTPASFGSGISTTSISLDSTAATPVFSAGTMTVDCGEKVYSLHHHEASADITTITAINMNDGDQFVSTIVNTTGSNIEISTGGTNNKSSFEEPANVEATQTAVLVGIRLIGNMHYSVTVFS